MKITMKKAKEIKTVVKFPVFICNHCDNENDNYCVLCLPVVDHDMPCQCPYGNAANWELVE